MFESQAQEEGIYRIGELSQRTGISRSSGAPGSDGMDSSIPRVLPEVSACTRPPTRRDGCPRHFARISYEPRLLALGRSWDAGYGPRALLACPGLKLLDLGLVFVRSGSWPTGWRITFLGANTPLLTVISTARTMLPNAIVIAVTDPAHLAGAEPHLAAIAESCRLIFAERGTDGVAGKVGRGAFDTDPVSAAERLTTTSS